MEMFDSENPIPNQSLNCLFCERCTGGSTNYKTAGLLDGPQRNLTILKVIQYLFL